MSTPLSTRDAAPGRFVSIVAAPKAFIGHIGTIQRNALASWARLSVTREIILLGAEDGVAEAAAAVGAIYCADIGCDRFGTPLVDSVFAVARARAAGRSLCYVNADIILTPEFASAVSHAAAAHEDAVVVARRWNLDVVESIETDAAFEALRARAVREATLFNRFGIDVFVFPRAMFADVPSFSIGRPYWDNWMIGHARRLGTPVVDVTEACSVIHQNHDAPAIAATADIRRSQQGLRNFWLAGDSPFWLAHVGDATHVWRDGHTVPANRKVVSVVIPHAGPLSYLRTCLRALSEQSYPRTYVEVIVVDNGPDAGAASLAREFPFICVTREPKPGPAAARNKGAAIARGDIIAFLDSDCRPAGNWIERAVASAEEHDCRCVIACNVEPGAADRGAVAVGGYEALVYHNQKGFVESVQACITGGMVVPRNVWDHVGPFNEEFREAACEDWEWSTRASSKGVRIAYAAHAVVTHPVHATWKELQKKSRRLVRGELLLAKQRRRWRELTISAQLAAYTRRLRGELHQIFLTNKVPPGSRFAVAAAAVAVWMWSRSEVRRRLGSAWMTRRSRPGPQPATALARWRTTMLDAGRLRQ